MNKGMNFTDSNQEQTAGTQAVSNKEATTLNVAIYCRTNRRDASCDTSIVIQIIKVSDHISRMGCSLAGLYKDAGFSGNDDNRPELNRLCRDIKLGKVNCVAVTDCSRLSRDFNLFNRYMDYFAEHGVRLVSLDCIGTEQGMGADHE